MKPQYNNKILKWIVNHKKITIALCMGLIWIVLGTSLFFVNKNIPMSNSQVYNAFSNGKNVGDFLGIWQGLFSFGYNLLIIAPCYLLWGIGDAIGWIGGANLMGMIFGTKGHSFTPPKYYYIFGMLGILIFILIGIAVIFRSINNNISKQILGSLTRNFMLCFVAVFFVPIMFFCINFIINACILLVFQKPISGISLANLCAQMGWIDGKNHSGMNFWNIPNYQQYSLFVPIISLFANSLIFFFLGIALVERIFRLFVDFMYSPYVIFKGGAQQDFNELSQWKDRVISNFMVAFSTILAFYSYMLVVPKVSHLIYEQTNMKWFVKNGVMLIVVIGGAFATKKIAQELSQFFGGNSGMLGSSLGSDINSAKYHIKDKGNKVVQGGRVGVRGLWRISPAQVNKEWSKGGLKGAHKVATANVGKTAKKFWDGKGGLSK